VGCPTAAASAMKITCVERPRTLPNRSLSSASQVNGASTSEIEQSVSASAGMFRGAQTTEKFAPFAFAPTTAMVGRSTVLVAPAIVALAFTASVPATVPE